MTNAEFAKTDEKFIEAWGKASRMDKRLKLEPSTKQASKWRNQKGIAWKVAKGLHRDNI